MLLQRLHSSVLHAAAGISALALSWMRFGDSSICNALAIKML
jgi:hypothetical protein